MSERAIIHFGAKELSELNDKLPNDEHYFHVTDSQDTIFVVGQQDPVSIFQNEQLNPAFRNALFLLDQSSSILDRPELLISLPANGIVLDKQAQIKGRAAEILDLKQVIRLNVFDEDALADHIVHDLFGGQEGLKILGHTITVATSFQGDFQQKGDVEYTLQGDFGNDWTPLVYWRMTAWLVHDRYLDFWPECDYTQDTADIKFLITEIDMDTGVITDTITLAGKDAAKGVTFYATKRDQTFSVQMLAKGTGTIHLSAIHLRHSRRHLGLMFPNGQRLISAVPLNSELMAYFDAGDLKPPLNVYFAGYRQAEGFEGNFMMQAFGAPFLLICDSRLEGGGFYFGDQNLENQVTQVIQETLARLHFKSDQLILSGVSMGTTPALYYGAQLRPRGIVVGKPLVNVGSIAENGRIKRPQEFDTASDVVLANQGDTSPKAVSAMNDRFWEVFKKGDFSKTIIAVSYMLQDDYDKEAFPDLYTYLTGGLDNVRLIHKGRVGRHNDDTQGVITWFTQQYRLMMQEQFGRHFA